MKRNMLWNLQMFAGETAPPDGGADTPPDPAPAPAAPPEIDYDKLAQIVQGKQTAAEDSVLRGYFRQQGLSKEDADKAIAEFKDKQAQNDPNNRVKELENELEAYRNKEILSKKKVNPADYDYVSFKASAIAKEKNLSFEKAVDAFLKDNPRFAEPSGGYRIVSTGAPAGGPGTSADSNDMINAAIRNAARKGI